MNLTPAIEAAVLVLARAYPPSNAPDDTFRRALRGAFQLVALRVLGRVPPPGERGASTSQGGASLTARLTDLSATTGGLFSALDLPDEATLLAADGALGARWPSGSAQPPPESLGAAYEALLGRVPRVENGVFTLASSGGGTHMRKATGSYYTPAPLVEALLDMVLPDTPVPTDGLPPEPPQAPTSLDEVGLRPRESVHDPLAPTIVDPSCGTGNFLLAALRRLTPRVEAAHPSWSPVEARRFVASTCIHGVELDALAVALCRLALWLEVGDPTLSLSAFDQTIRRGHGLLGATPARVAAGVPEAAWDVADRAVARTLRTRDRAERRAAAVGSHPAAGDRLLADAWCAAFVWPSEAAASAPTYGRWCTLADAAADTVAIVETLAAAHAFFHWHLEFPAVFAAGGFDVVIGNPPYLNQLETPTAVAGGGRRLLGAIYGDACRPYTDLATLFLVNAHRILRAGGRQALVHPLSLFAAKDAAPARQLLASEGAIRALWMTTDHIFPAALVTVCAVCLEKAGARAGVVTRRAGNAFTPASPLLVDMDTLATAPTWGELIADLVGVPPVRLSGSRVLRDLAGTTADFRDQFYGLLPFVVEDGPTTAHLPRLVITGLVDPASNLWGTRPCRFGKQRWERPRVDLPALYAEGFLAGWARGRLVPKLVVATQSRIIEAFADPTGEVLNTVPTITVTPRDPADLWRLLAVILAPPVSAWALGRYVGTGLSVGAIKLSAEQVGAIPLPTVEDPWAEATRLVERASSADEADRRRLLIDAAGRMCDAYDVPREPVLSWWVERYERGFVD